MSQSNQPQARLTKIASTRLRQDLTGMTPSFFESVSAIAYQRANKPNHTTM